MLNRSIGSNKETQLLNISNQELGELEKDNRKTHKSADMKRVIIKPDAVGILRHQEGLIRNEDGDLVDE